MQVLQRPKFLLSFGGERKRKIFNCSWLPSPLRGPFISYSVKVFALLWSSGTTFSIFSPGKAPFFPHFISSKLSNFNFRTSKQWNYHSNLMISGPVKKSGYYKVIIKYGYGGTHDILQKDNDILIYKVIKP